MNAALGVVKTVDAGAIARDNADPAHLPEKIRAARIEVLRAWKEQIGLPPSPV